MTEPLASADPAGAAATAGSAGSARATRPRRGTGDLRQDRKRDAVLLLPGLGWLLVFFAAPLAIVFVVSLGQRDQFGGVYFATFSFDSYLRALEPTFLPTVLNSLKYATVTTVLSLLVAYPMAYFIARYGGRRKALLLVLVMLPFWTSWVIRTYAWMILLRDNGVVNSVLETVGIGPFQMLNTEFAVVLGMTYGFLPFTILPLYASIDRLDPSLVHAARDLYASGRSAFLHVTLPLTMPGIVAASILTFIPSLGDFVTPDLLGGAQTTTVAKVIQGAFLSARDWPFGAALGFLMIAFTIAGTVLGLRWLQREVIG